MLCHAAAGILCAAACKPRPRCVSSIAPPHVESFVAPSAWTEWSLRDVGLLDATVASLAVGAAFAAASSGGRGEAQPTRAAAAERAVREAERAVAESVAHSPCNGPNMDLLDALEEADREAARANQPSAPLPRDPNELPSVLERAWRHRRRRGPSPRMMAAPPEALPDIVVPSCDAADERLWVPQTDCLSFRPLCLCVSQGYYVNLLRFVGGGTLGCHRHSSPVHAHTIRGSWGYKEHSWTARPGTYVFEPPGETHTLVVGEEEMVALFHVTGALLYCDPENPEAITGFDDVFTKLEKARKHYEAVGLGADYVQRFVR